MEYIVELYIFVLAFGLSVSDGVDYASPLVFDANFYVNSNGRKMHSIHTVAQAKEHWLNHGIDAGLQGIGSFHSKQYIARYPDLSAAFHSNYRQAINHYLTIGNSHEKRIGVQNHYDNRWSINSNDITIGTSRRFGGAVESLTWNNKASVCVCSVFYTGYLGGIAVGAATWCCCRSPPLFCYGDELRATATEKLVNSYDHGRQIQMACNSDPYTECYNPTEAGGRNDGLSDTTHTHINWVRASGNVLETEVYPAFWLIPGSHEKRANLCQRGHPAMNHQATYSYPFHKKVVIGAHGINNIIQFDSNFTLGGDWPQDLNYIQMEAPATYLNGDMNQMYNFNHQKNLVENHHTNRLPTVLSTPDHQYAMGIYSPPGQPSDTFMYYNIQDFHIKSPFASTTKLDVVYRKRRFHGNGPVTQKYTSYLCVGTLGDVSDCMGKIMNAVPRV